MRSSSNCTARNASDVRYFWAARHTYGVPKGALTKTTISHSPSKMMDGRGGWTISEIKGGSEEGGVLLEFPSAPLSLPLCVLVGVVMSICSSAVRIALVSCFEGDAVAALAPDESIGIALPPISALMNVVAFAESEIIGPERVKIEYSPIFHTPWVVYLVGWTA